MRWQKKQVLQSFLKPPLNLKEQIVKKFAKVSQ